jgi:hypothetical protein
MASLAGDGVAQWWSAKKKKEKKEGGVANNEYKSEDKYCLHYEFSKGLS